MTSQSRGILACMQMVGGFGGWFLDGGIGGNGGGGLLVVSAVSAGDEGDIHSQGHTTAGNTMAIPQTTC